jgi:hypothetical protein
LLLLLLMQRLGQLVWQLIICMGWLLILTVLW